MNKSSLLIVMLCLAFGVKAQESFSLSQALTYAKANAYQNKQAAYEVANAQAIVKETIGSGLPQINASADYQSFATVPVTPLPAELTGGEPGTFVPVKFNPKQNMTAAIEGSQLIFDGSYLVGLKSSKEVVRLFTLQQEKSEMESLKDVADAYYTVLVAKENAKILEQSIKVLQDLALETEALYEAGFASETDASQVRINLNNVKNNLEYARTQISVSMLLLKFRMGMPLEKQIILTDDLDRFISDQPSEILQANVPVGSTLNFKLAEQNLNLQTLNRKAKQMGYLPSLAGFFSHQQNSFGENFDFFKSTTPYFPSTVYGLSLKLPIFSSFKKHNQIKQAKVEELKAELNLKVVEESFTLELENTKSDVKFKYASYLNQKENLNLSESIRQKTIIKYKEGVSSSFDVSQSENQFLQAQNAYINSLLNYLQSRNQLDLVLNKF